MAWMYQCTLSQHSVTASEIRLKCTRFQLNFQWFSNKLHLFWIIWNPCNVTLCHAFLRYRLQWTSSSYILTFIHLT